MYRPFVLLATCIILISDVHLVIGGSVDQLSGIVYHPVSVIQEKFFEHVPILSKSAVLPSEVAYTNIVGLQASYAKSLYHTERDIANGYASHVLSSSVELSVPENLEYFVPKETIAQSGHLLNYAVNAKPVASRYTTVAKSVPVTFDYSGDVAPRFSRILTGSHVDNTYNLNVLPSEPTDVSTEAVKKAPLYTEAIFKPWPSLKK